MVSVMSTETSSTAAARTARTEVARVMEILRGTAGRPHLGEDAPSDLSSRTVAEGTVRPRRAPYAGERHAEAVG